MSRPRIAISGAGPAGLTLGLLLHKRGIPCTLFDLRDKPTEEELSKPCGMFDLHDESGLAALKECGIYDQFLKLTGECSEAQKVADKDGNILYQDEGELSERPEISRHALSKLLMSHLPEGAIRWGYKLRSASRTTSEELTEIELDFGPQGKQQFDLVVGGDGAWSRVRRLLTGVMPHYGGNQNITLTIRNVTTRYPNLADLVGQGTFSALGTRHGVMSQRGPQDSARIYVFLSTDDEQFPSTFGLADKTATQVKQSLFSDETLLGQWGPKMKHLVTVACDEDSADNPGAKVDLKPMYTLPVGHTWKHQTGATLIGDAAHLMGPWAGEGVNLAMWDSLELSHAITQAYDSAGQDVASFQRYLDPLIKDFEVGMAARCKEKAEETASNQKMMLGEDGANAFVQFFLSVGPPRD